MIGILTRAIFKTIVGPIRYFGKSGYNAKKYWDDRFKKYGMSLKGPGNEGLSEKENEDDYKFTVAQFKNILNITKVKFPENSVLDVGVGNGTITKAYYDEGCSNYTGMDITDVLFDEISKKFPDYKFIKNDITGEISGKEYDVVSMIDVAQHVVDDNKFNRAISNLKLSVKIGGVIIIGPFINKNKRHFFYLRSRSCDFVRGLIGKNFETKEYPFRMGAVIITRRTK